MRYTLERLERREREIRQLSRRAVETLKEARTLALPEGPVPQEPPSATAAWGTIGKGDAWGEPEGRRWFAFDVTVPERFSGFPVRVRPLLSDRGRRYSYEALAYVNRSPVQGIDWAHECFLLQASGVPGSSFRLDLLASTGARPAPEVFVGLELYAEDPDAWALSWDLHAALGVARALDEASLDRARILRVLEEAERLVDLREPFGDEFYASCAVAREYLRAKLYEGYDAGNQPEVLLCGHSHIDVAWLWPLLETRHKSTRTFSTVLSLMEQYPDYRFTQSQPQLYRYLESDAPALYQSIRSRISEGRWEATGGMWVEADCNVSSGEALVRQFLYGKRYFREELGVDSKLLWLPDVFGYSWALPQIIRRSGMKWFMTTKISWNQYNTLPYDSFVWQGIDGSEVLTHFITATDDAARRGTTYNGNTEPKQIINTWRRYQQKQQHEEVLLSFGHGDGGGGPTREMLEVASRLKGLAGCPRVRIGTAEGYFERLDRDRAALPRWNGELYLEYHRGTYTTQARNKWANRKSELLLRDAEFLASLGHLRAVPYPHARLLEAWELVLLNQFHDILPGSSIQEVYVDSLEQYGRVAELGEGVVAEGLASLAEAVDTRGEGEALLLVNTLSWDRDDIVSVPAPEGSVEVRTETGDRVPTQRVEAAGGPRLLLEPPAVPSLGWRVLRLVAGEETASAASTVSADEGTRTLTSPLWTIEFDAEGRISRLYDRTRGREVLAPEAKANVFRLFEDKPLDYDAWDIDVFYQDKSWEVTELESFRAIEQGPVRAGFELRRPFRDSVLVQRVFVYANTPRIDFETEVEWYEKHLLLKVEFPVDIHSTRATYEIQYGNVERPTHWNTSWDWARFETCAQKWVDLSEGDYGVSLLNDCKYGHDIRDNVLRLTLLKAPTSPDPDADMGNHAFTYSLLPHEGDFRARTVREAYELNVPLRAHAATPSAGALPSARGMVRCNAEHVIVEAVKKAEDSDALIVRVYEWSNRRGQVTLTFAQPIVGATEVNLLEEADGPNPTVSEASLSFAIAPYEIRTFAVRLAT